MYSNIYEYKDYKQFLLTSLRRLPNHGRGQLSKLAKYLKTSPVAISQILRGVRDFTHEQALEVSEYFQLSELESEYFIMLVLHSRAGTFKLKKKLELQLDQIRIKSQTIKARVPKSSELDEKARNKFYSQWYYSGIRLITSIDSYNTIEKISAKLNISVSRVREVMEFLLQYGLCIEDRGQFKMGPKSTHIEASSPLVTRHHTNWRLKALENMENLSAEELFYTGPMTLSRSSMKKIRAELVTCIENSTREAIDSSSENLACLNIDFFHLKR